MKSIWDKVDIDLDPDGTTIRELNKTIHEQTSELFKLEKKIDKLTTQLVSYEATIGLLKDALIIVVDECDDHGKGVQYAYNALKQMGWKK